MSAPYTAAGLFGSYHEVADVVLLQEQEQVFEIGYGFHRLTGGWISGWTAAMSRWIAISADSRACGVRLCQYSRSQWSASACEYARLLTSRSFRRWARSANVSAVMGYIVYRHSI
jgi:hypothetical protein